MDSATLDLTPDPADVGEIFRFLDLPAELRNIIYDLCLLPNGKETLELRPCPPNQGRELQLLRVCRQIHREGLYILYKTVVVATTAECIRTLSRLAQTARSLIKNVQVEVLGKFSTGDSKFIKLMKNGLRYCFRLNTVMLKLSKDFEQHADESKNRRALRKLKWLPQSCNIVLVDGASEWARAVVAEVKERMATMSAKEYAQWQNWDRYD